MRPTNPDRAFPAGLGRVALVLVVVAIGFARLTEAADGGALFARPWLGTGGAVDRLGPLFNARSCAACHGPVGRPRLVIDDAGLVVGPALVLRLSPGTAYGRQLQTSARKGLSAEGRVRVDREPVVRRLADGTQVTLERLRFTIADPAFGPPARGDAISARLAPPLLGLDLLARIPEAELRDQATGSPGRLAHLDHAPLPADGPPASASGTVPRVGRFGLKAAAATIEEQVGGALLRDLGLASPAFPFPAGDCEAAQRACLDAEAADVRPVIDGPALAALAAFAGSGEPRPAPTPGPSEMQGLRSFRAIGCAACHRPTWTIPAQAGLGGAARRSIAPWTDLLLHDMGDALGDAVAEGGAGGREWRPAPLWGLGARLAAGARLLHDGRARDALEAILWHEGNGAAAAATFAALPASERAALLAFLAGL